MRFDSSDIMRERSLESRVLKESERDLVKEDEWVDGL